jgi:mono/diheme cytochrome c family protein
MKPTLLVVAIIILAGLVLQSPAALPEENPPPLVAQGRHLFLQNCAHCHADDASGDEGPDLRGTKKSDTRIMTIVKEGIKGEMPSFKKKLKDEDVRALIAFIRTLKK